MRPVLKCLHLLGVVAFMGALAAQLVLAVGAGNDAGQWPWRHAAAQVSQWVVMPGLLLATLTGLGLMMVHAPFMAARWVWVKALLGMVVGVVLWLGVHTAVRRAEWLAATPPDADPAAHAWALQQALRTEWVGGWAGLALSVLAVGVAVWRPRWGDTGG